MMEKNIDITELQNIGIGLRHLNKKIVLVAGCYDLIHVGHTRYLHKAKQYGDVLVVALASNNAIKWAKGPARPILDESVRAEMLAYLACVDYVYIHRENLATETIRILKPHILVMSHGDWVGEFEENEDVKAARGIHAEIIVLPRQTPHLSTSSIIEKISSQEVAKLFTRYLQEGKAKIIDKELHA